MPYYQKDAPVNAILVLLLLLNLNETVCLLCMLYISPQLNSFWEGILLMLLFPVQQILHLIQMVNVYLNDLILLVWLLLTNKKRFATLKYNLRFGLSFSRALNPLILLREMLLFLP